MATQGDSIPLSYLEMTGADFSISFHAARITITEIAKIFDVTRRTVYAWQDADKLPHKAAYVTWLIDRAMENKRLPLLNRYGSIPERIAALKFAFFK